jgi:hypothetical protein
MKNTTVLLAATLLGGGCAAIPPDSDYVSCAGSEKYKVCERLKNCPQGGAVLIKDHIREGQVLRTEEAACGS